MRCALILCFLPCAFAARDQEQINNYRRAWELASEARISEAINSFKEIIAQDPSSYRAYDSVAYLASGSGQAREAETYFLSLLGVRSNKACAEFALGRLAGLKGLGSDVAVPRYVSCIQLRPDAAFCYDFLADAFNAGRQRRDLPALNWQRLVPRARHPYSDLVTASLYHTRGDDRQALRVINEAIPQAKSLGDDELLVRLEVLAARVEESAGALARSFEYALTALDLWQNLDDQQQEIMCLRFIAGIYAKQGNLAKAKETLESARSLAGSCKNRYWEASLLDDLQASVSDQGQLEDGLAYARERGKIWRDLNRPNDSCRASRSVAGLLVRLGRFSEALGEYRLAYECTGGTRNQDDQAFALRGMGNAAYEMGDYFRALEYQTKSVRFFEEIGRTWQAGAGLGNIGDVYAALGNFDRAIECYRRSLKSGKEHYDGGEVARVTADIGTIYLQEGKPHEALNQFERALRLARRVDYEPFVVSDLLGMGVCYRKLGNRGKAVASIEDAMERAGRLKLFDSKVEALNALGDCSLDAHDLAGATGYFQSSLELSQMSGLIDAEVNARRGLAEVDRREGNWNGAFDVLSTAADRFETARSRALGAELESAITQSRWGFYQDIVGVLAHLHAKQPNAGYDRRAFEYAERGRARAFLDTLVESRTNVTNRLSAEQGQRQRELEREVSRTSAALLRDPSPANGSSLSAAERKLSDWALELRWTNAEYRDLEYPQPSDTRMIQALLPGSGTALIEYFLGDRESLAWVVTSGTLRMVSLPSRPIIEGEVARYRNLVLNRSRNGSADSLGHVSRNLFSVLLAPLMKNLNGVHQLIVIPDGLLHYLPFEALARNTSKAPHYLIEDFIVRYAPSASVYGKLVEYQEKRRIRDTPTKELLAYGDPAFGPEQLAAGADARSTGPQLLQSVYRAGGIRFPRLPFTRTEVDDIAACFPRSQVKKLLGAAASEASVKRQELSAYKRIHFATHAVLDEQIPNRSGVVLSLVNTAGEDGVLRMGEIFNLRLDADLVVLSACQTGLGKLVRGEGMIGLTRAFLYAGSRAVAVSLWKVNDLGTADFMHFFYRHMAGGESAGVALRRAKLEMIRSNRLGYRDPYFWAPFVLQGLE